VAELVADDFAAIPRDANWVTTLALLAEAVGALGPGVSLGEEEAARHVQGLLAHRLVQLDGDARVQYRPASDALAAHVATLEKVYRERPVTLIRVIYGLRDRKIRSFADAFKLRGK
jgi:hypothetical protein